MQLGADDRKSVAVRITGMAALVMMSGICGSRADEKSGAASLFDPHLTMPGPVSPTFTRPEAVPPSPGLPNNAETAEPTSAAAAPSDVSGSIGPQRRHSEARHATPLGSGRASWYKHPGRTASGETFKPDGLTAAHHTLPLGSRVRVVNKGNGRSVIVRITDRTNQQTQKKRPYIIDLSRGSARALGIAGIAQVALYKAD